MTALKPIESSRVLGVPAGVYSANRICAHPECAEPVPDRGHHIFPRSSIGNGLYFVQAWDSDGKEMFPHPIPHVTGLCREHHDAVERHAAWIRYESVGIDHVPEFVWYDRVPQTDPQDELPEEWQEWVHVGPLDPQPGGHEKVRKPKRRKFEGEERRRRRRITIAVPTDRENGGEVWDEILAQVKERLVVRGLWEDVEHVPAYEALVAALWDWLTD